MICYENDIIKNYEKCIIYFTNILEYIIYILLDILKKLKGKDTILKI